MVAQQQKRIVQIIIVLCVVLAATAMVVALYRHDGESMTKKEAQPPSKEELQKQMSAMPMVFQKNQGQTDASVHYLVKNGSTTLYFTPAEIVYQIVKRPAPSADDKDIDQVEPGNGLVLRQTFTDSKKDPEIEGESPLESKVNYFIGNDKSKWVSGASTFGKVRYKQLYPGIDLVVSGTGSRLQQTYELAAGIKPSVVAVHVSGAKSIKIDEAGLLIIDTDLGAIAQTVPQGMQEINGQQVTRFAQYSLIGKDGYGITVAGVDEAYPLSITF